MELYRMVRGCFWIGANDNDVGNYVNLDKHCISVHCCSGSGVVVN